MSTYNTYKVKLVYSPGIAITVKLEQKDVGRAVNAAIGMVSLAEELLTTVIVKDVDLDA